MTAPRDEFAGHTPGPWRVECDDVCFSIRAGGVENWTIADVYAIPDGSAATPVNARLIGAAPSLLAEVETLKTALAEAEAALRGASFDLGKAAENLWRASWDIPDQADCANQASAARESSLHYLAKAEDAAMVLR